MQAPAIVLAIRNCHLSVARAQKTAVTANVPSVNNRIVLRPYLSAAFPNITLPVINGLLLLEQPQHSLHPNEF